ncbi:hypothetical protein BGZ83_007270 [Gryganskiella cystojenkinii]|nr:hypothetical protein BGZ83_007270 [Gryganskiella cystojenkinii]
MPFRFDVGDCHRKVIADHQVYLDSPRENQINLDGLDHPKGLQLTLNKFAAFPEFSHRSKTVIAARRTVLVRDRRSDYGDTLGCAASIDANVNATATITTKPPRERTRTNERDSRNVTIDKGEKLSFVPSRSYAWTEDETERVEQLIDKLEKINGSRPDTTQATDDLISSQCNKTWSSEEDVRFRDAVAEQIGSNVRPLLSYLGPAGVIKSRRKKVTNKADELKKSSRAESGPEEHQSLSHLTPISPELERIDREEVADKVQPKSPANCKARFYNCISLRNRGLWTTEEKERQDQAFKTMVWIRG